MTLIIIILLTSSNTHISAGKSAITEGPDILNKKASAAYQHLSLSDKEQLEHQVHLATLEEKKMTKKDVIIRGEKIFIKIQKMVGSTWQWSTCGLEGYDVT